MEFAFMAFAETGGLLVTQSKIPENENCELALRKFQELVAQTTVYMGQSLHDFAEIVEQVAKDYARSQNLVINGETVKFPGWKRDLNSEKSQQAVFGTVKWILEKKLSMPMLNFILGFSHQASGAMYYPLSILKQYLANTDQELIPLSIKIGENWDIVVDENLADKCATVKIVFALLERTTAKEIGKFYYTFQVKYDVFRTDEKQLEFTLSAPVLEIPERFKEFIRQRILAEKGSDLEECLTHHGFIEWLQKNYLGKKSASSDLSIAELPIDFHKVVGAMQNPMQLLLEAVSDVEQKDVSKAVVNFFAKAEIDANGHTLLHYLLWEELGLYVADRKARLTAMRALIDAGVNIDAPYLKNKENTPLKFGFGSCDPEVVALFKYAANVEHVSATANMLLRHPDSIKKGKLLAFCQRQFDTLGAENYNAVIALMKLRLGKVENNTVKILEEYRDQRLKTVETYSADLTSELTRSRDDSHSDSENRGSCYANNNPDLESERSEIEMSVMKPGKSRAIVEANTNTKESKLFKAIKNNKWTIFSGLMMLTAGIVLTLATCGVGIFAGAGLVALGLGNVIGSFGSAIGAAVFTLVECGVLTAGIAQAGKDIGDNYFANSHQKILRQMPAGSVEMRANAAESSGVEESKELKTNSNETSDSPVIPNSAPVRASVR